MTSWPHTPTFSAAELATRLKLPPPTIEQQAVIEAGPEPAIVVAGAGSGKTETMSARVVWLVANGYAARDQILGLTFTRKAAGELADRIDERLAQLHRLGITASSDDPHARFLRPAVSTYNSFADALARDFGAHIGRDPNAELLSPAASWLAVRRIVETSTDPLLLARDERIDALTHAVLALNGELLDNRADPDAATAHIKAVLQRFEPHIPVDDIATGGGTLLSADEATLKGTHTKLGGFAVVAHLAERYQQFKREARVYDYADQVSSALDAALGAPHMRAELAETYRFVLLDEYQDTSVLQTTLLATLFAGRPVMAVGDPHQSIYSWRGASANNLAQFAKSFAPENNCAEFTLSTSWRNDRTILQAANAIIRDVPTGVTVNELVARPEAGDGWVTPQFYDTIDEEAAAVADFFAQTQAADDTETKTDARAHTGAILFRTKKHMQLFAEALGERGIAHRIIGLGGLLDTPEIADLVATLRVLTDPHEGSSLIRLLAGARFEVGVADLSALQRLASWLTKVDGNLQALGEDVTERVWNSVELDEKSSIIDALDRLRELPRDHDLWRPFSFTGRSRLLEAARLLHRLRGALSLPIPELLRLIEQELRLDIELAANESLGPAARSNVQLRAFNDQVRSFVAASDRVSPRALLSWLDRADAEDELKPRPEPPEPGVVQLLTIHGAKGLEWDSVAVVRMTDTELPSSPKSTFGWLDLGKLPYTLRGDRQALPMLELPPEPTTAKALASAISEFKNEVREHARAEERRLAYVALTRARTRLRLSGSYFTHGKQAKKPSPYLVSVCEALGHEPPAEKPEAKDNPREVRAQPQLWPLDPLGHRRERVEAAAALVQETPSATHADPLVARLLAERDRADVDLLAPVRLSASTFKDYVTDFTATVQRINRPMPEKPYTQTRLGTLFHQWVEQRALGLGAAAPSGSGTDDLFAEPEFDDTLGQRPITASEQRALDRLRDAFLRSEWADLAPVSIEQEINYRFEADGVEHIIICKLDAVYQRGDRIEIVDWKTGQPPRDEQQREERMLQLALYRIAYHRRYETPLDKIDVALFYVGDELVLRGGDYSEDELRQRFSAASAAR